MVTIEMWHKAWRRGSNGRGGEMEGGRGVLSERENEISSVNTLPGNTHH